MSALPHGPLPTGARPDRRPLPAGSAARGGAGARAGVRAPARPASRLVVTRRGHRRVAVLVAVVLLGVLAVVAVQARAAQVAFDARALEREIAGLEHAHERLTAQVAALESPDRLRRIAMEDLGMVEPETATFLDLTAPGRLATVSDPQEPHRPLADVVKQVRAQR